MPSPAQIRAELRALRRALPAEWVQRHSAALARHLADSPLFQRSQRIAAYLPNDGEADPQALIAAGWARGKALYLPILRFAPEKCLWFGRYRPDTALVPNRYRIPEPALDAETLANPRTLDMALVPLVGFDLAGQRIGMGGGYYDRTFAYLRGAGQPRAPWLVGLAFECQKLDRLPAEPWDVPLDGVVTEAGFYRFGPGAE